MKRCAVLFLNPARRSSPHPVYLRNLGFIVDELPDWPEDDDRFRTYHVIIINLRDIDGAPMLAARLRAKPHFDRRLLIGLVPPETPLPERRGAEASGFDDVLNVGCDGRELTTRLLRGLRARPELRCVLPPSLHRRSAA